MLGRAGPITLGPRGCTEAAAAVRLAPAARAALVTPALPGGTTLPLRTTFALGPPFGATFSLSASALEGPASPVAGAWAGCPGRRAASATGATAAAAAARRALGLQLHRSEAFRGV